MDIQEQYLDKAQKLPARIADCVASDPRTNCEAEHGAFADSKS